MDDQDIVTWCPSQTPIPALQALINEAQREDFLDASPLPPLPGPPRRTHIPSRPPPSTSNQTHADEQEPEATAFVELLKEAFKKLDENSLKKQRLAARAREKQRGSRMDKPHPLAKTASASAIGSSAATSVFHGRHLAKTASLGPRSDILLGTSTSSPLLNIAPKSASAPLPVRASSARSTTSRKPNTHPTDGSPMQDVIDLMPTDTEWESSLFAADTSMFMQVDGNNDTDSTVGTSFFLPEPPMPSRVPPPKLKSQPLQPSLVSQPSVQTQRVRTGPPPLGMRRALLQPSQSSSSQGTKGLVAPRFKPPLLISATRTANKGGSGTKPAATTASKSPTHGEPTKAAMAPKSKTAQKFKDADSSFDVSFDMDIDALEETMKAYD